MPSHTVKFHINDHEFSHYTATDSHGSGCTLYGVNGKNVDRASFHQQMRDVAGPAALMIREYLHGHFLWGNRLPAVFDEKVAVTINGTEFTRLLHSDRKFGRGPQDFTIDGETVSAQQFREGLLNSLKDVKRLVYDGLVYAFEKSRAVDDSSLEP